MPNRTKWLFLFFFLWAFRTIFALYTAPVAPLIDEAQTYLVGLKCYTTGTWPYFGPDVNGAENPGFNSQVPGALEGLLIGLPFYLLPIPEMPFILVALLSTLGAALLAWYIQKRLPQLSPGYLFVWIAITPWSLFEGAHVINPAFIFLPSVLFFIGFMETLPFFSLRWLTPFRSNAFMGFSLFWIMQFHFSYVYFIPLAAFSLFHQMLTAYRNTYSAAETSISPKTAKKENVEKILNHSIKRPFFSWRLGAKPFFYFFLGSLPMLALMVPTFIKYGLMRTNVVSGFIVPFNWENVTQGLTLLARFLSLVCFELPRFLGDHTNTRISFLTSHPFLTLPGVILWMTGLLQPIVLLAFWFKKKHPTPGWKEIKWFLLLVFLLVWVSFWFTSKNPVSHIYMCFYPWLMLYSCYCWSLFAGNPKWKLAVKVFLVMGLYFQLGYTMAVSPEYSIYTQRAAMAKALHEKNYHLFGERRPNSLY
jgi:hypothetical protein